MLGWRQLVQLLLIVAGRGEGVADDLLDAHAAFADSGVVNFSPQLLCLTFSPRANLMPGGALGELHFLAGSAPAELDDLVLPADGVGRAVQDVDGGHAAGELAVDVDVVGSMKSPMRTSAVIACVRFVHAAVGGDVRMAVDDARA